MDKSAANAAPSITVSMTRRTFTNMLVGIMGMNLLVLVVRTFPVWSALVGPSWGEGDTDDELPRDMFQGLAVWLKGTDYDPRVVGWIQLIFYLFNALFLLAIVGSCAKAEASCMHRAYDKFPDGTISGLGRMYSSASPPATTN